METNCYLFLWWHYCPKHHFVTANHHHLVLISYLTRRIALLLFSLVYILLYLQHKKVQSPVSIFDYISEQQEVSRVTCTYAYCKWMAWNIHLAPWCFWKTWLFSLAYSLLHSWVILLVFSHFLKWHFLPLSCFLYGEENISLQKTAFINYNRVSYQLTFSNQNSYNLSSILLQWVK